MKSIKWTKQMLERFKKAYEENKTKEQFTFDGNDFIVGYAKHLIEYLETKFE